MGWPVIHKDPGATAATVYHDAIIQWRVEDVSSLHRLSEGEVSEGEQTETLGDEEYTQKTALMYQRKHKGVKSLNNIHRHASSFKSAWNKCSTHSYKETAECIYIFPNDLLI